MTFQRNIKHSFLKAKINLRNSVHLNKRITNNLQINIQVELETIKYQATQSGSFFVVPVKSGSLVKALIFII